jgi:exodeoxyribonuclease V gamma subunit
LLSAWVWSLLASACDRPVNTLILGRDRVVVTLAMEPDHARAELAKLLNAWQRALQAPLPVACQTALAWLDKPEEAHRKYNPGGHGRAEGDDVYLKRLYPDFDALMADGQMPALAERLYGAFRQWMGSHVTAAPLVSDESEPGDDADAAGRAA